MARTAEMSAERSILAAPVPQRADGGATSSIRRACVEARLRQRRALVSRRTRSGPPRRLVNLADRRIEVHQHPGPAGYHLVALMDDPLEVEAPELGLKWKVAELLP